jgi:hypothetical protein
MPECCEARKSGVVVVSKRRLHRPQDGKRFGEFLRSGAAAPQGIVALQMRNHSEILPKLIARQSDVFVPLFSRIQRIVVWCTAL